MRFRFGDKSLEMLFRAGAGREKYPRGVVDMFLRRVRSIEAATDERDLRALKSLHFEKLQGQRDRYSIRLNEAWRLILTFEKDDQGKIVVIIEMNRHYGD
ncbi:MAG: type II toxin-antitoxin system RelE/ParE family toxin [Nitrospiraceae bacterium]|nr:type II toxin-antitoxin system RelE/ParE family toxin [Nitrospiraceae bacterium]